MKFLNCVFASMRVITLSLIFSDHRSNIIFSVTLIPLSKNIDPIKASQLSAKTLSSIIFFLLHQRLKYIYLTQFFSQFVSKFFY